MSEYQNNRQNKGHPVLTVALSAVVSLVCGLGGGWFAYTHLGGTKAETPSPATTIDSVVASETAPSEVTTVSETGGSGLTIAEVAAKSSPSVVEIVVSKTSTSYGFFGGTYTSTGAGSGVIISSDGYIITNDHVASGVDSISVKTYDGKEYEAQLVGTDSKTDIAVIKVEAENLIPATLGDSSKISAGDTAIVIGNPLGTLGGSVTQGIISATNREIVLNKESMELIQTDATINSGNSGGGLFDGNGNLIGIVNSKDSGATSSGALIEGIGFAIPINTAMDVAQELIDNGEVLDRATIGVHLQELATNYGNYSAGLYIADIIPGGAAEAAGLKAYDKFISCDDTDITSYTDLSKFLKNKQPGDTISVKVERDGQQLTFNVTLTNRSVTKEEG